MKFIIEENKIFKKNREKEDTQGKMETLESHQGLLRVQPRRELMEAHH